MAVTTKGKEMVHDPTARTIRGEELSSSCISIHELIVIYCDCQSVDCLHVTRCLPNNVVDGSVNHLW